MLAVAEQKSTEVSKRSGQADKINRLHSEVMRLGNRTIEAAAELGRELLKVKANVPHGQLEQWMQENLEFTPRQARRYMQVAKKLPAISKRTSMSVLTMSDVLENGKESEGELDEINFVPPSGCMLWFTHDETGDSILIEPSEDDDFYFVTRTHNGAGEFGVEFEGIGRPIRHDYIPLAIEVLGGESIVREGSCTNEMKCEPLSYHRWLYSSREDYTQKTCYPEAAV